MIIVITGPTAVGKTKLSIELAKRLNGEIINADSTQVYKGLDIATAKIKENEKEGIPHHLFDIKNIDENYTVYDYQKDGRICIDEILKKGKTPIIVGGTGLYINALLYDYKFEDENSNYDFSNLTDQELYNKLKEIDPNISIHMNNRKRVERAYSYYLKTGKCFSEKEITHKLLYNAIFIGLTTDRSILYDKINKRVDNMLKDGLIDEAYKIYLSNIRSKAVMTPIGYKELFDYFDKKCSLEDSIELIKQRSRHYAKRQYTWFNNKMNIKWFNTDYDNFSNTVLNVMNYIESNII